MKQAVLLVLLLLPCCAKRGPVPPPAKTKQEIRDEQRSRAIADLKEQLKPGIAETTVKLMKDPIVRRTGDPDAGQAYLEASVPNLIASMKNQDEQARTMTGEILRVITGQQHGSDIAAWQAWHEEKQRKLPQTLDAKIQRLLRLWGSTLGDPGKMMGELKEMGEAAVPALVEALRGPNRHLGTWIPIALREMKARSAVPALMELVLHEDPDVRKRGTAALKGLCTFEDLLTLAGNFKAEDDRIRNRAAEALQELTGGIESIREEALAPMLEALGNRSREVRVCAVSWLTVLALKFGKALDGLILALQDKDPKVRNQAISGFAHMKDDRIFAPLVERVGDPDPNVASNAVHTLTQKTGQRLGFDYKAWKKWLEGRK